MRTVHHDLTGPLILREDMRLNGRVHGDVTVPSGVRMELNGVIRGGLLVCAGAFADIRGVVQGALHAEGGAYAVSGQIGTLRGSRRARHA